MWIADCKRNLCNPNLRSNYKGLNSDRKTWVLSYYYLYYTSDVNIDLILQSDRNWNAGSDSCAELFWACKMVWCSIKWPSVHLFILCCTANLISYYLIWILIYMGFKAGKQNTRICSNISCDPLLVWGNAHSKREMLLWVCVTRAYTALQGKDRPCPCCVCTALSPMRTWSITWIPRDYFCSWALRQPC